MRPLVEPGHIFYAWERTREDHGTLKGLSMEYILGYAVGRRYLRYRPAQDVLDEAYRQVFRELKKRREGGGGS
jgi:hypothetical protein